LDSNEGSKLLGLTYRLPRYDGKLGGYFWT